MAQKGEYIFMNNIIFWNIIMYHVRDLSNAFVLIFYSRNFVTIFLYALVLIFCLETLSHFFLFSIYCPLFSWCTFTS